MLGWEAWCTLAVIALVLFALLREWGGADTLMMAGLLLLGALGVVTPAELFAGFANPVLPTIAALFVISAALRDTGAVEAAVSRLFLRGGGAATVLRRLCPPIAAMSAFSNNTTIVALATPSVIQWSRRARIAPSRLLLPLSHATILGGLLTVIGTSTTLAIAGLVEQAGLPPVGFFETLPVGLAVCCAGLLYLVLVAPRRLPDRADPSQHFSGRLREYVVALRVTADCPLVGRAVEAAGLRHLPGLFLVEIHRTDIVLSPVSPEQRIRADDRLVFAGVVDTIADLQRIPGLVPVEDDAHTAEGPRRLIEAVVSPTSPLVGRNVRDSNFRTVYAAAIVGVHRSGERVGGKIGDIVLKAGDTLLLKASSGFVRAHANSLDFHLVSEAPGGQAPRRDRAPAALLILAAMVLTASVGWLHVSIATCLAAGAMVAAGCLGRSEAQQSISWSVLLTIGAGLGLAAALTGSGAAAGLAAAVGAATAEVGPWAALAMLYGVTLLMAEFLNHTAAGALMFPVAVATAAAVGADARPFVFAVVFAASCAFALPFSYQTHLLVFGPGGYRARDFVAVGAPLDLLCAAVALGLIPVVWPL